MTDAGPGHNQPPSELFERNAELIANVNRWLKERPVIRTDEEGGLADDFIGQLRENRDDVEAALKAEREPLDAALFAVRAKYREPMELLDLSIRKLRAMATAFLEAKKARLAEEDRKRREAARAAQEEAERLSREAMKPGASVETTLAASRAHEAAEKAAAAATKGPKRARIKGDYSAKAMTLTTRWRAEVVDDVKALAHFAEHPEVRIAALEAIRKVASAMARDLKDESAAPPGIKFVKEERA
jgi:hypothetical protein